MIRKIEPNDFLYGRISDDEQRCFFSELSSDKKLYLTFVSETNLESQIYSLCAQHPGVNGLCTETEWGQLIENAIEGKRNVRDQKENKLLDFVNRKKVNTFRIPTYFKYLLAACFIAAVVFGGFVSIHQFKREVISSSLQKNVEKRITSIESVAHIEQIENKEFTTDTGSGLLYIDKKTAGIVDKKTSITYTKKDTSVVLDMTSGSVLFTVEKGKYRSFTIITPFARIRVTGTIFRVETQKQFTKVSVIEGNVIVHHATKNEEVILNHGNVAVAESDTLSFFQSEESVPIRIPERKLLDAFVNSLMNSDSSATSMDQTVYSLIPICSVYKYIKKADSICDLYLAKNRNSSLTEKLADSRKHETKLLYDQALAVDCNLNCLNENDTIADVLQFRIGALLLLNKDTTACIANWDKYQNVYPAGLFTEPVITFLFWNAVKSDNLKLADSLILSFSANNKKTLPVEQMAFYLADHLRVKAQFEKALYWYEFILDNYHDNDIRSQAAYWVGNCIIQIRLLKTEKRAESFLPTQHGW